VDAVLAGDREAFSDLVRRYERAVRACALVVARDRHTAEDVAQDSFVAAFTKLATLRDGAMFGPWPLRIARRQGIQWLRRRPVKVGVISPAQVAERAWDGRLDEEKQALLAAVILLAVGLWPRASQPDGVTWAGVVDRLRALTKSSVGAELWVLWIDPARDYLCVRHEHHVRQGRPWGDDLDWQRDEPQADEGEKMPTWMREYDQVVEIIDAGQTPEGHWYPRTLRMTFTGLRGGKRFESGDRTLHVYLDTAGSIPDSLFDWPAGMPVPE